MQVFFHVFLDYLLPEPLAYFVVDILVSLCNNKATKENDAFFTII